MAKKPNDTSARQKRYIRCPGSDLGAHAPNVFLEIRPTKKPGAVFADCVICQCRIFGRGRWNDGGGTAAQARATCPPGVPAIDGRGQAI